MHEWQITEDAIKEIIRQVKENRMKKIDKVYLSIGEDDHLTDESVRLCFTCLAKGTILEETKLEIKKAKISGIIIDSIDGQC